MLSVFFTLVASKAFEADDFFWRFEALADFSLESANSIWRLSLRGWDSNPGRLTSFFPEEFMAPAKLAQTNPTRINPTDVDKLQLEGTFIRSRPFIYQRDVEMEFKDFLMEFRRKEGLLSLGQSTLVD